MEDLLIKLYRLYKQGSGKEKDVAKKFLMKKLYDIGITLEEYEGKIFDQEKTYHRLYKERGVTDIQTQIIFLILGDDTEVHGYGGVNSGGFFRYLSTEAEHMEICSWNEIYTKQFRKQKRQSLKKWSEAFLQKFLEVNNLFIISDDPSKEIKVDHEIMRIRNSLDIEVTEIHRSLEYKE